MQRDDGLLYWIYKVGPVQGCDVLVGHLDFENGLVLSTEWNAPTLAHCASNGNYLSS